MEVGALVQRRDMGEVLEKHDERWNRGWAHRRGKRDEGVVVELQLDRD